ncbi:MAG: hypothetical protein PHE88_06435 [Elusimicrobia bacterium]|nr:hypothetical protein [Elusimicrobiota bacterium]
MKKNLLLVLTILFILGCGKDEKKSNLILDTSPISNLSPVGTISCYSGKINNGSSMIPHSSISGVLNYGFGLESDIYIKSIEISTTGTEWIKVVEGPIEVKVKDGEIVKIGSSIIIPEGKYEGLRLILEPEVKFLEIKWAEDNSTHQNEILLNKLPSLIRLGEGGTKNWRGLATVSDTILFTSSNGYLIPFDIEKGKETFLVFDISTFCEGGNVTAITDWQINIVTRATRFLY